MSDLAHAVLAACRAHREAYAAYERATEAAEKARFWPILTITGDARRDAIHAWEAAGYPS